MYKTDINLVEHLFVLVELINKLDTISFSIQTTIHRLIILLFTNREL